MDGSLLIQQHMSGPVTRIVAAMFLQALSPSWIMVRATYAGQNIVDDCSNT
jgi:hypothetical protein